MSPDNFNGILTNLNVTLTESALYGLHKRISFCRFSLLKEKIRENKITENEGRRVFSERGIPPFHPRPPLRVGPPCRGGRARGSCIAFPARFARCERCTALLAKGSYGLIGRLLRPTDRASFESRPLYLLLLLARVGLGKKRKGRKCLTSMVRRKPGVLRPGFVGMRGQWSYMTMAWRNMSTPPPALPT